MDKKKVEELILEIHGYLDYVTPENMRRWNQDMNLPLEESLFYRIGKARGCLDLIRREISE